MTSLSLTIPSLTEIQAALHKRYDWSIQALQQLIGVDSIAPNELECQHVLQRLLVEAGLPAQLVEIDESIKGIDGFHEDGLSLKNRPNLVVVFGGQSPGGRSLILNAHIDTVEWKQQLSNWRTYPLEGVIVDGRIYGRGAVDDKGQIIMAAAALLALKDLGYIPAGQVILESVIAEEPSGNGTLALCAQGYTADGAINLEATENQVHYGHRGVAGWCFRGRGHARHGSLNGSEQNVIIELGRLAAIWNQMFSAWVAPEDADYGPPTTNVGTITGGSDIFTVPVLCKMECAVRYAPGTFERIQQTVALTVQQFQASLASNGISVQDEFILHHDASAIPMDTPLLQLFYSCVQTIQPHAQLLTFPGGTDARHLNNRYHIPTVIFGSGSLRQAHAENEFLPLEEWQRGAACLALMITRWCEPKIGRIG